MKTASKTHPMIIVAAASVTVLSLAGVAALAGWMPGRGEASTMPSPLAASAPATTAGPTTLAIPSGSTITVKPKTEARVASNRAARALEPTAANIPPPQSGYTRVANSSAQAPNAANDNGIYVENARPAGNTAPAPAGYKSPTRPPRRWRCPSTRPPPTSFDNTQHGADLFNLAVPGNIYTRIMNPTADVLEKRVAELEGGIAGLALSLGQAAITYAIQTIAEAGDNIVSVPASSMAAPTTCSPTPCRSRASKCASPKTTTRAWKS
jgi:hypothetical protein